MSEKLTLLPHEYPDTSNMILEEETRRHGDAGRGRHADRWMGVFFNE